MLSQQQNPPETSHSRQQKNCLDDKSLERDIQSFSIRQYALASRQNDINCSWPFPEKYLQICFKHGIHNVLPPFEPRGSAILSLRQGASFKSSGKDNEKKDSLTIKNKILLGRRNFSNMSVIHTLMKKYQNFPARIAIYPFLVAVSLKRATTLLLILLLLS
ncbi:hypothetical protein I3842_01G106900 [Carya illinoinensis]|uniref:Uncharacterized protein n=1 Tax=Carya illinoinensis TaxID=32201 RepID=A0A922FYX4_CARIL|nr:hypothetical protein I3842_01G106900 [Carya illinoinensis]